MTATSEGNTLSNWTLEEKKPKKKPRDPNFAEAEKHLLTELVGSDDMKNIIENRKTDKITPKMKDDAWLEVTKLFNAQSMSSVVRSCEKLKTCWQTMKKTARKKLSDDKLNLYKTGGGAPVPSKIDSLDEKVLAICGDQFTPVDNTVDDDGVDATTLYSTSTGELYVQYSSAPTQFYPAEQQTETYNFAVNDVGEYGTTTKQPSATATATITRAEEVMETFTARCLKAGFTTREEESAQEKIATSTSNSIANIGLLSVATGHDPMISSASSLTSPMISSGSGSARPSAAHWSRTNLGSRYFNKSPGKKRPRASADVHTGFHSMSAARTKLINLETTIAQERQSNAKAMHEESMKNLKEKQKQDAELYVIQKQMNEQKIKLNDLLIKKEELNIKLLEKELAKYEKPSN